MPSVLDVKRPNKTRWEFTQKQSVRFEKIELNVPIDDSQFRAPAAKNAPERTQPTPANPTPPALQRSQPPPGASARRD